MFVAIDYIQGTTGSYMRFVGNTFLIPTVEFKNPFDDQHKSHNTDNHENSYFDCGHYYLVGFPEKTTHKIWMDIDRNDLERLKKIKQFKLGASNDVQEHSGILDKPQYYNDINVFRFKWRSLFDLREFVVETHRLSKWLNLNFIPSDVFLNTHREFIRRHPDCPQTNQPH